MPVVRVLWMLLVLVGAQVVREGQPTMKLPWLLLARRRTIRLAELVRRNDSIGSFATGARARVRGLPRVAAGGLGNAWPIRRIARHIVPILCP